MTSTLTTVATLSGIARCAGDLATLRSTDGGATWAVLERRLDQAPVVNGEPFLGALGSGTQRFGAEAALTDALGVLRGGAYGPGLNSLLNPLRGDAGVEETLRGLQMAVEAMGPDFGSGDGGNHANVLTSQAIRFAQIAYPDACRRALDRCLDRVDRLKNACLARAGKGLGASIRNCRLLILPKLVAGCIAAVLARFAAQVRACHARYAPQYERCRAEYEWCKKRQGMAPPTRQGLHGI